MGFYLISFTYIRFYLSGSTGRSQFEIEFEKKNCKTYACALKKIYPTFLGWPTCACSYEKFSSHLGGIPTKSSEIPPRRAGSLII